MRSSSFAFALLLFASPAYAQSAPQGFAVERFSPVPAGGGWFANDELTMHGGLGGALSLTTSYARGPLRAGNDYVEHEALIDAGFAITYETLRLSVDFVSPLVVHGRSMGPQVDPGTSPDLLSDTRIALAARVIGAHDSAFRLGVEGELFVPSGERADFVTDGRYRGIFRIVVAGDRDGYVYSAHVGLHIRTLSDESMAQGPRGSELLFGAAFGPRFPVSKNMAFVFGPEIFGTSAISAFAHHDTSALEGLLTARFETLDRWEPTLRLKLGGGGGLHPFFGAPEWRAIIGIELTGNR